MPHSNCVNVPRAVGTFLQDFPIEKTSFSFLSHLPTSGKSEIHLIPDSALKECESNLNFSKISGWWGQLAL